MTNEDILNADSRTLTSMPEEMINWLCDNYTKVGNDPVPAEYRNLKWEWACKKGNDWKYGRFKICREKMLWRGSTFDEFYGGGIVD